MNLAANCGKIDAKIFFKQIYHYQSIQTRLQNKLQKAKCKYNAIRKSTKREIKAHAFTKTIVDMQWQICTKLYALLKIQKELIMVDKQGKSEIIEGIRDFLQWSGETMATLEQKILRLEQTMAVKNDIIKTLVGDV